MSERIKRTPTQRLKEIAEVIEHADRRCEAADGPASKIQYELTDSEWRRIYKLASGRR